MDTVKFSVDKFLQVKDAALEILDELPYALVIIDEQGIIQFINRWAVNLFEWPKGGENGLIGKSLEDTIIPKQSRDIHVEHRKEFIKTPNPRPMRGVEAVTKSGNKLDVDVSIGSVQTEVGKLLFAVIREKANGTSK